MKDFNGQRPKDAKVHRRRRTAESTRSRQITAPKTTPQSAREREASWAKRPTFHATKISRDKD